MNMQSLDRMRSLSRISTHTPSDPAESFPHESTLGRRGETPESQGGHHHCTLVADLPPSGVGGYTVLDWLTCARDHHPLQGVWHSGVGDGLLFFLLPFSCCRLPLRACVPTGTLWADPLVHTPPSLLYCILLLFLLLSYFLRRGDRPRIFLSPAYFNACS